MLLTLKDLAKRWAMDERKARRTVRECGLEMLRFDAETRHSINWGRARFELAAVEAFEASRRRVVASGPRAPEEKPRGKRRLAPRPVEAAQ